MLLPSAGLLATSNLLNRISLPMLLSLLLLRLLNSIKSVFQRSPKNGFVGLKDILFQLIKYLLNTRVSKSLVIGTASCSISPRKVVVGQTNFLTFQSSWISIWWLQITSMKRFVNTWSRNLMSQMPRWLRPRLVRVQLATIQITYLSTTEFSTPNSARQIHNSLFSRCGKSFYLSQYWIVNNSC